MDQKAVMLIYKCYHLIPNQLTGLYKQKDSDNKMEVQM